MRRNVRWRGLALLVPLYMVAACATTPPLGGDPQLRVYPGSELPKPDAVDLTVQARPYFVGPFDKLTVDVFGIAELSNREVTVDETGKIRFPPAGIVEVGGKTLAEIDQALAAALRANHVREPQVTVRLKEAVSQVLTIDGEVKNPGVYPVLGNMTLTRAMAVSNGVTDLAKLEDVVVFRTVRGQRYAALYDLKAIRRGAQPDPEVFANDVVVVGDSPTRRLLKDLVTLSPLLTTPILLLNAVK